MNPTPTLDPRAIFEGSDGEATKALYAALQERGPVGMVALNLFRACKCSCRAKVYRGGIRGRGSYRSMAYERKQWSIDQLVQVLLLLDRFADPTGIRWGWKHDPAQPVHAWVLYVDLPSGQVSFHTERRGIGPDYIGEWDGQHASADRIIAFAAAVLSGGAP